MLRKTIALAICAASAAAAFSMRDQEDHKAKQLVLEACTACHTLDRVTVQRLSRQEWRQEIAGMLSEGVPLTDEEIDLVVGYLAQHFGPEHQ